MLGAYLSEFLKNLFELLERKKSSDLEKSDENIMYHFVSFLMNVFNDSVTKVDGMQLSDEFKASIVEDLLAIRGDIFNLITHLSPKVKLGNSQQEFEICNSKNKPVNEKCFTSNLFTNISTLDEYYWNSGDFVSFNVVQESEAPHTFFEKSIFKYEDLKEIQHTANNTKYKNTQTKSKRTVGTVGSSKSNPSDVESSKKVIEIDTTRLSLLEESIKCEESLPNDAVAALSLPDAYSENLISTKSKISDDQTSNCTVNHISVRSINALDDLVAKSSLHSIRYISILHLNVLAVINVSFAIDKMGFNSIIEEGTQYKCLLCSVYTAATVEGLNDHLQSHLHMDKLANNIIWVSSLGTCVQTYGENHYRCCTCSTTVATSDINKHFKTKAHKEPFSSATAACKSILEEMKFGAENEEMNTQTLIKHFETVLHQHKVKVLGKQLSCNTCHGNKIPMSLHNLYTHIGGQQHWPSYYVDLKQRYTKFPKIRSSVDQTYNGFINVYNSKDKCYCQICKVFIDGVSINIINSHIKSVAHYKFLVLFLANKKISGFVDLNEGGQLEGKEFSLPGTSRDKLDTNTSKAKLKTHTSQKTKGPEKATNTQSVFVAFSGSNVMFNYNIAIDIYSWNGLKTYQSTYLCAPCDVAVPESECSLHIAGDSHKTSLSSCPLDLKHLTRKINNNILLFCVVCGDWVQKEVTDHSLTKQHRVQMEQLTLECENWKTHTSRNFATLVLPTFSRVNHNILVDILKQNQLIFLNQTNFYNVFCKLCSQYIFVQHISALYEHVSCTSHFSAYVENMNMNWAMVEPKYVNGIVVSMENNKISYCLVCNFTLPSETAGAHCKSDVHEHLLPIFIEHVFSNHCLNYIHDIVVCLLCERKLGDKFLDIFDICEHVKRFVHVTKFKEVLKKYLYDISGAEVSIDFMISGVQRFQRPDISYCSTCSMLVKGVSDANVFQHTNSKVHYVFEYLCRKKFTNMR